VLLMLINVKRDKKLGYRRETARCFVSLGISLNDSGSHLISSHLICSDKTSNSSENDS